MADDIEEKNASMMILEAINEICRSEPIITLKNGETFKGEPIFTYQSGSSYKETKGTFRFEFQYMGTSHWNIINPDDIQSVKIKGTEILAN